MSGNNKSTLILVGICVALVVLIGSVAITGWVSSASAQAAPNRNSAPENKTTPANGTNGRQGQPGNARPGSNPVQTQPGQEAGEEDEELEQGAPPENNAQPPRRPGGPQQGTRPAPRPGGPQQGGQRPGGNGNPPATPETTPSGSLPGESPQTNNSSVQENPAPANANATQRNPPPVNNTTQENPAPANPNATQENPAPPPVLNGTVSAINLDNAIFTFIDENNTEWATTVTTLTQILRDGELSSLESLQLSESVTVSGKINQDNHSLEALRIALGMDDQLRPAQAARPLQGQVKSVDAAANKFVITTREQDIIVIITGETRFTGYNNLVALQPGKPVFVAGDQQADNSLKARAVSNQPLRPPASSGSTDSTNSN